MAVRGVNLTVRERSEKRGRAYRAGETNLEVRFTAGESGDDLVEDVTAVDDVDGAHAFETNLEVRFTAGKSGDDLVEDATAVDDVDGAHAFEDEALFGVDAEQPVQGLGQVFGTDRALAGLGPEGIGLAMDVALLHPTTCHGDGEDARVVVASVGAVDFGRTAKFRADEHEGGGEHATLIQVPDEAGKGLIKGGRLAFEGALDVAVMVPAAIVHGDHAHACLDEASCQQETLSGAVAAIFVAQLVGFGIEVKGFAGLAGADQAVGGAVEAVHRGECVGFFCGAEVLVHGGEKAAAAFEALVIHILWRREIAHGEAFVRWIAAERKGAVGAAHVAAALVGGKHAWDGDVGRQVIPAAEFVGDDGAEAGELDRGARAIAGEHVVGATLVRRFAMGHRADQGDLVQDLGAVLELLAHILSRHAFHGTEGAAVISAGKRLGVPGLVLGHAARQVDVDDGAGDGLEGAHLRHGELGGLQLHELGKGDAEPGEGTDLQEVAPTLGRCQEVAVFASAEGMHFHKRMGTATGLGGWFCAWWPDPPILAQQCARSASRAGCFCLAAGSAL